MASYCQSKIRILLNFYGLGQFIELLNIYCWSCLPEIKVVCILCNEQGERGIAVVRGLMPHGLTNKIMFLSGVRIQTNITDRQFIISPKINRN